MLLFIMFLNPTMNATQCRENTQALSVADVAANGVSPLLKARITVLTHGNHRSSAISLSGLSSLSCIYSHLSMCLKIWGRALAKRRCRSSKPQQFSVYPGT